MLLAVIWTRMMTCVVAFPKVFSCCINITHPTQNMSRCQCFWFDGGFHFPRHLTADSDCSVHATLYRFYPVPFLFWVIVPMVHGQASHITSPTDIEFPPPLNCLPSTIIHLVQLSTSTITCCSNYQPRQLRASTIAQW